MSTRIHIPAVEMPKEPMEYRRRGESWRKPITLGFSFKFETGSGICNIT